MLIPLSTIFFENSILNSAVIGMCDRICQKGSYTRNYKINIEESYFEILNTVYL